MAGRKLDSSPGQPHVRAMLLFIRAPPSYPIQSLPKGLSLPCYHIRTRPLIYITFGRCTHSVHCEPSRGWHDPQISKPPAMNSEFGGLWLILRFLLGQGTFPSPEFLTGDKKVVSEGFSFFDILLAGGWQDRGNAGFGDLSLLACCHYNKRLVVTN